MVAVGVRLSRGIRSLDASQREHGTFKLYQPCKVSRTVRLYATTNTTSTKHNWFLREKRV